MANSQPRLLPDSSSEMLAWLFPGQGAQAPGMGRDLWEGSTAARRVFEIADETLGYALSKVCFDGPEEKLRDTRFAQPAILTTSIAGLAAAVESGVVRKAPAFVAGHSLGEYTALVAAGALKLTDGLRLIQERARLMAEAGESSDGTLAAIMGLDEADVMAVCREADVDVCNLNLPAQTVIGGSRERVARAMELAKARGAARVQELNVSGAFHSRLMATAIPGLKAAIEKTTIHEPSVPVVANSNAQALKRVDEIREELGTQIARPVRWHESVKLMESAGVTTFVEFGPGRVLSGLVKRLVPNAGLINIGTLLEATRPADLTLAQ